MSLRFRTTGQTTALLAGIVYATIVNSSPSLAADIRITISNFAFTPEQTTVAPGTKVMFKNGDDTIHSVLADDGSFHSQALDSGDEFSVTFVKAGVFAYHCGLHPFMQGKITVR
jgi:plastocyanin